MKSNLWRGIYLLTFISFLLFNFYETETILKINKNNSNNSNNSNNKRISLKELLENLEEKYILRFNLQEGFSNQIMSICNAIKLSKRLNYSLVIPNTFRSRNKIMFKTDSTGLNQNENNENNESNENVLEEIPIEDILNITKLTNNLKIYHNVKLISETNLNLYHQFYIYHSFVKFTSLKEVLHELNQYKGVQPIVLDVDNLFLRMIPIECNDQKELSSILHIVIDSFIDPIQETAQTIRSLLGDSYNSLHLRIESDAQIVWKETQKVEKSWPQLLSNNQFSPSTPLYIACGDCKPQSVTFHSIHTKSSFVNKFPPTIYKTYMKSLEHSDIIAAIDFLVLIHGEYFAGSIFSGFSHLVVSQRLYNEKSNNICIYGSSPVSFLNSPLAPFGMTSPDITCSNNDKIRKNLLRSKRSEIISHTKEIFSSVDIDINPFNELMYILLGSNPIPLVYHYFKLRTKDINSLHNEIKKIFPIKSIEYNIITHSILLAMNNENNNKNNNNNENNNENILINSSPLKILLVSHNTLIQGAPLMLFYLSKMFREKLGFEVDFLVDPIGRGDLESWIKKLGMGIISKKSLDLINTNDYNAIYLNTIVSWYHNKDTDKNKTIVDIYNKKSIMYVHESLRTEIFKLYPLTPNVMKEVNSLIFVTNRSMHVYDDVLIERKVENKYIIANGLPDGMIKQSQILSSGYKVREHLGIPPHAVLFVISGDVYKNRNQEVFVKAAEQVIKSNSRILCYFMIIGFSSDTAYQLRIRKLVKDSKYSKRFLLFNKMTHEKAMEYVAASDVYVSLALFESFGLALLEAMTMGLPIIVAKLDGVPDVIYKEALDVEPTSITSVSKAMKIMLDSKVRTFHTKHSQQRSKYFQQKFQFLKNLDVLRKVAVLE